MDSGIFIGTKIANHHLAALLYSPPSLPSLHLLCPVAEYFCDEVPLAGYMGLFSHRTPLVFFLA